MTTFKIPFDACNNMSELAPKIKAGNFEKINNENYSISLKNLIYDMLQVNPDKRPTLNDILCKLFFFMVFFNFVFIQLCLF